MSEWELYFAAASGHEGRVSEFLLVDGINVNYKDSDEDSNGQSPLYNAAAYGHVNIIRLLHQAGAELEIRTNFGSTPLHVAAFIDHRECVALLLMLGAKIDSVDTNNETPLHYASSGGKTETAKLLIECGAVTSLRNNDGKTPRDVAVSGEIKSLFGLKKRQKDGKENKKQLLKNAMDAEKWDVATILALNAASEDPAIFQNLLISVTSSENINVDCALALLARTEGGLSSLDNEIKKKLLSDAVQNKNSVAVKTLSAANLDEKSNFQ